MASSSASPTEEASLTAVTAADDAVDRQEKAQPPQAALAGLPESVEFGVPLQRNQRPLQRNQRPLQHITKTLSLRAVTGQMQMALAVSSQELQRQEVMQSYVGGGGDDDDIGDEIAPRARAGRGATQKPPSRPAVTYWPPQSWSLLEPEENPANRGRRRRAAAGSTAQPRRQRQPRRDEVQVGFTDKSRDVAVTDGHDIKMSLRQYRQVESSVVDIRATWWTYVSEAEAAAKRGQHKYACQLFDKCLRMEPPTAAVSRCRIGRSVSCRRLKQIKQALIEARLALEADSRNPHAQLVLADAMYSDGELELALVVYWRGLQLRPGLDALKHGTRRCEDDIMKVISKVSAGDMVVPPGYTAGREEQEEDNQPTLILQRNEPQ